MEYSILTHVPMAAPRTTRIEYHQWIRMPLRNQPTISNSEPTTTTAASSLPAER